MFVLFLTNVYESSSAERMLITDIILVLIPILLLDVIRDIEFSQNEIGIKK